MDDESLPSDCAEPYTSFAEEPKKRRRVVDDKVDTEKHLA